MDLKIQKSGDVFIVNIDGEMDLYSSNNLKELVLKLLEKNIQKVIINMENVEYIDSSGIGTLIYICSACKKRKSKLRIANVRGSAKKVIELTRLGGYFPISDSVLEAVKEFAEKTE